MLLCKRFHRLRSPLTVHIRLQSSHSTSHYPFKNVRAFPFKLSPYDAQRYISPFASVIRHERLFESLVSRVLPGLGFEPVKPFRFTPVYFPAWILDAELKGEVTIKGDDRQASVQIHNAYIPGSDYKILSSVPLAPTDPHTLETVPFSEDLLRQFDLDIACIPYNISPFSLLDISRHLSYSEATIAQDFRFTASSLKTTLLAVYPVLIPVYLAQYEYDPGSGKQYHTLFIEAYGTHGNIWSEQFSQHHSTERAIFDRIRSLFGLSDIGENELVRNLGYPKRFVDIVGFSLAPHQELGQTVRDYLEAALELPSTPTALAAASVNIMDTLAEDKRNREFTSEERTPIIEWLKLGSELMMLQRMHEAMTNARQGGHVMVTGPGVKGGRDKMAIVDGAIQHIVEKSTALHTQRQQVKPVWAKTEEDLLEEKSNSQQSEPIESKPEKDQP